MLRCRSAGSVSQTGRGIDSLITRFTPEHHGAQRLEPDSRRFFRSRQLISGVSDGVSRRRFVQRWMYVDLPNDELDWTRRRAVEAWGR